MLSKIRFSNIFKTPLFQASFYSGVSAFVKLLSNFFLGKVIAMYLGPTGLGLIGQLSNFTSITLVIAGAAFSNGIVKYVSEYNKADSDKIPILLATVLKIVVLFSLIVSILLIILANTFSSKILFNTGYSFVFVFFGAAIIFSSLNTIILAVINGKKNFKKFNILNIVSNIIALIYSIILIVKANVDGALISLVTSQAIIFIVNVIGIKNEGWLTKDLVHLPINRQIAYNLLKFFAVSIVSTLLAPVVLMMVRNVIVESISISAAGIWELSNRISAMYLMFFSLTFTTYYLPRFSEIFSKQELYKELKKIYFIIIPLTCIAAISIYLLRNFIVITFFSKEFLAATELFKFQLLGDVLKLASWVLGFLFLAKGFIRVCLVTELLFNAVYWLSSCYFIKQYGLVGASYAYFASYLFYLPLMIFFFKINKFRY